MFIMFNYFKSKKILIYNKSLLLKKDKKRIRTLKWIIYFINKIYNPFYILEFVFFRIQRDKGEK